MEEENEWFCKISKFIRQLNGTPAIDLTLPSTCNSKLHDTNEEHFWPSLQLQTCEIKCLASICWLSDLILYHIIELIDESRQCCHTRLIISPYHSVHFYLLLPTYISIDSTHNSLYFNEYTYVITHIFHSFQRKVILQIIT